MGTRRHWWGITCTYSEVPTKREEARRSFILFTAAHSNSETLRMTSSVGAVFRSSRQSAETRTLVSTSMTNFWYSEVVPTLDASMTCTNSTLRLKFGANLKSYLAMMTCQPRERAT